MTPLQKHRTPTVHNHRTNPGTGIVVVPDYISIVGSALTNPAAPVIDVLVRDDPATPAYWQQSMRVLIQRLLDPERTGKNFNIVFNPQGAHAGPVKPLLDLVLRQSIGHEPQAFRMVKASHSSTPSADVMHDGFSTAIAKAVDEKRYTFSVVYIASTPDAIYRDKHREFVVADELQRAQWEYVRKSARNERRVYLQHGIRPEGAKPAGEWVDIATLPFPVETTFQIPNGPPTMRVIPANSVWMGTIWDEWSWPKVRTGAITGYSLGGQAVLAYI